MRYFLVFLLLLTAGCSLEKRERPGILDPYWDVIWAGDVYLDEDHMIGSENTLVIRPGTRIHFTRASSRVALIVFGGLEIQARSDDAVEFLNDNGLTNEIYVFSYPQYRANYCHWADFGDNKLVTQVDLSLEGCRVGRMEARGDSRIDLKKSVVGFLECAGYSSLTAEYSSFDRDSFPSLSPGDLNLVFSGLSMGTAHYCNFYGNSGKPLSSAPVVEDFTATNLDLSGNYWRTTDTEYIATNLVFNDGFGAVSTLMPSASPFPVR